MRVSVLPPDALIYIAKINQYAVSRPSERQNNPLKENLQITIRGKNVPSWP